MAAALKPRLAALEVLLLPQAVNSLTAGLAPPLAPRLAALERVVGGESRVSGVLALAARAASLEQEAEALGEQLATLERAVGVGASDRGLPERLAVLEEELGLPAPVACSRAGSLGLADRVPRLRDAAEEALFRVQCLEEELLGRPSAGTLRPRISRLEVALNGRATAGSLLPRLGALEGEICGPRGPIRARVVALEADVRGHHPSAALFPRIAMLEADVSGQASAGALAPRVAVLEADVCGRAGAARTPKDRRGAMLPRVAALEATALAERGKVA
uniref:Uncharacterized protein n=1 Tax=Alexandrium monilatum TaxID=311494 RepID=A0A7S4RI20_9DINO